jgi:glycosyltransferase involved in cell wall biosynthesis
VRVLLVNDLHPDEGWGSEVHIRRLTAALRAAGDDVELFAGEVTHRGLGKALDLWDPRARRALAARAAAFRPDIVHHGNVVRELSTSVLGVPRDVPTVMTFLDHRLAGSGDYDRRSLRGLADALVKRPLDQRVARRRLDACIAVSGPLADRLRAAGYRRVHHVPVYSLDPLVPLQPVTANRDIGYVGRLTPDKGIDVLATAFEALASRFPDARLRVAGEGSERQRLEKLGARLGADRVELLGRLDEKGVSSLLAGVRVLAVPSLPGRRPEGSPLAAVEAARHGRPVVASDDEGLVEMVRLLGAGENVPAGDSARFADALSRVLADDDLAGPRVPRRRVDDHDLVVRPERDPQRGQAAAELLGPVAGGHDDGHRHGHGMILAGGIDEGDPGCSASWSRRTGGPSGSAGCSTR